MDTCEWYWTSKDGLRMYSKGWAPKGRPKAVVCLIHGLGEHIGRYEHVAAVLNKEGYALLGFDLRGHGKSGGRRGHAPSLEAYLSDIDLFLEQTAERYPGRPCFLYGHSLGGILVLAYPPLRKPKIAGVIATAPSMHSALEQDKLKVAMVRLLSPLLPTLTVPSGLDPKTLSHNSEVVHAYINDPLVHDRTTLGFGKSGLEAIHQTFQNAPNFPVPVLIMHGTKDALGFASGSQKFAALVPKNKVTLKLWEGLYHEIHNEPEKAQVFKVMINWLDEQVRKGK